jgi:hypothetical protein
MTCQEKTEVRLEEEPTSLELKPEVADEQEVPREDTIRFRDNTFMESSNGTLGGGDLYSVLWQL